MLDGRQVGEIETDLLGVQTSVGGFSLQNKSARITVSFTLLQAVWLLSMLFCW